MSVFQSYLGSYVSLVRKDIVLEIRGKQFIVSSAAFGVLMVFIMGIALNAASRIPVFWSSGLLWMAIFFTVSLGLNRRDDRDNEFDAWRGLWMAPLDRSLIYYAKWTSSSALVFITESALTVAYFIILNQPFPPHFVYFVLVLIGGAIGLTGIATFVATLATASSMRDLIVPLLLFPLTIPLFLALIHLTVMTLSAHQTMSLVWMDILIAYIVVFAVLPWLLYELLLEV
ncbi:heme exporter protein CcmB [Alicyclobacillus sp. SO9]|uniref:heme exporter protein CcmB n=1 Tax=Alicyclobacillus sp. SO9 TaxID=2665646 RepID=UPI0018E8F65E|nr:heme exporter protein CcmB [Alicyclobacillus sp. SO9]QQE76936.1 heme exporter protein CcmB [Alicyclobacillus sp. SO9]